VATLTQAQIDQCQSHRDLSLYDASMGTGNLSEYWMLNLIEKQLKGRGGKSVSNPIFST
jgi:hypothetical protein